MAFLDTKHKKKSFVLTLILHVLLLILLFLFGLKYLDPPLESGVAINFGTTEVGSGNQQPTQPIQTSPTESTPEEVTTEQAVVEEEVVTQDTEEAPVIEEEEKPTENKETPKETPKEKPKKKPTPVKSTTDALSSVINAPKNEGVAEGSEGNDKQSGDKGNPDGNPDSNNYYGVGVGLDGDGNYLLGGRKAIVKKIIVQDCNQEGTVVVDIDVDRQCNVTKAVPGVKGTNNNSKCLLDPAKEAALQTKFNSDDNAPARQIGKIIYRFSLSE